MRRRLLQTWSGVCMQCARRGARVARVPDEASSTCPGAWRFCQCEGDRRVCVQVTGNSVYSKLKFESGVHRVQRVPATETQGRVHTSTATVAIMPEVVPQNHAPAFVFSFSLLSGCLFCSSE